ncbi:MAG: N-acetyl-gamma-glutamyl-phosphate reductase [Clostridia bacterium]|nr:N-acetyl-gamma-glutamyl-phosphate reductase [Clostridia bacterium]
MTKVFIDGSAGTTGLRINERLFDRRDLELIRLPEELRKDTEARKDALNRADVAFLCLPDAAAIEAVSLIDNPNTAVIDTSTAHRVSPQWTYGFAELKGQREKIQSSKRIANPGCHASGFIALIAPLVQEGLLSADARLSCVSLTGYSGGGKKMITEYQEQSDDAFLQAPRQYGLTQQHKHLPEMQQLTGLTYAPAFCPIVAPFYAGMEVTVPIFREQLKGSDLKSICELYADYYQTGLVRFVPNADEGGFLSASAFAGRDDLQISVFGNDDRILLVSRFDNLGKGASGAAIQNMNILLGLPEDEGLQIS